MLAWCHVSSDPTRGNNKRKTSMSTKICQMYDQTRAENPNDIGPRNENQMKDRNKTRLQEPNEESGGSTKRSRVSEEGDYVVYSNQETPNSGGSIIQRPIGRDVATKKGKGKASLNNEFVEELRTMRITRESEIEVMNKRLEIDKKIE
ncbi:hypothetical protein Tco_0870776 [Tanacetum coccineum]